MHIQQFRDQYESAAPLYGLTPAALRQRDDHMGQPAMRWLAFDGAAIVAAVTAAVRPDGRTFLSFVGTTPATFAPLAETSAATIGKPVHTFTDGDDEERFRVLQGAGFVTELIEERFRVQFDRALARLGRAVVPRGFSIRGADTVDLVRLLELDNALRQDVSGCDGWSADLAWFADDLSESPPFDPSAYLVAIDDGAGEYAALVRIWRNRSGPRFGMVGVRREYRSTTIGAVLIRQALLAASTWGHESFVAETALTNHVIHPRMVRLGAESLGRILQMVRVG